MRYTLYRQNKDQLEDKVQRQKKVRMLCIRLGSGIEEEEDLRGFLCLL